MAYSAQNYGNQGGSYGGAQDNAWNGNNYGGNRETTRGAAEVLRNMSNTTYSPTATAAAPQAGFTATNTSNSARYPSSSSTQQPHAVQPSYGQTQARPRSVNANRASASASSRGLPSPATAAAYPAQRTQNMYTQQQQRPDSPAQQQYNRTTTPVNTARNAALSAATQYTDYSHRQLPSVEPSRGNQNTPASSSYSYADNQMANTMVQTAAPTNVSEQYNQTTATVDPMAVYDPWPVIQRQQEARRQQKAIEDAARAEEERKAEEIRQEEEKRKAEEEERVRQAQAAAAPTKAKKTQASKKNQNHQQLMAPAIGAAAAIDEALGEPGNALEAEIRAMMSKMRELNSKDPQLLARIWEEERRAKAPKSPTVQAKATPQPATAPPAQASTPQVANQRKKAVPKENGTSMARATPTAPVVTPVVTPVTLARPQAQAQAVAVSSARTIGNTIWPPEKKTQLAQAAAAYLNAQNPNTPIAPERVLSMLDGNPSYIELCEQLEAMSVKLDRAAFAKNLLTAVPDVNSASKQKAQPSTPQVNGVAVQPIQVPPPIAMRHQVATPGTPVAPTSAAYTPAATPGFNRSSYPPFPSDGTPATPRIPVAEMVPIKAELKPPANKEEAARKRNFNDLIDLTLAEDEDLEPPPKRQSVSMYSYESPGPNFEDAMDIDGVPAPANNFPVSSVVPHPVAVSVPPPQPLPNDSKLRNLALPLDRKKALRRNEYNIKTIARDVLLACGRHPEERSLNAHLEILKSSLPSVTNEADLSTLRWDLIDPGQPPRGYYRDGVQALAEDADDEDDSEDERQQARPRSVSHSHVTTTGPAVQALIATNPFKKRRGRPPRHSFPDGASPATPHRSSSSASSLSASAPRPSSGGVGYSAFRTVAETMGPDGNPLPKKKGRPVGWRKAIHGSVAAQARPAANKYTGPLSNTNSFMPAQPSALRNVRTGEEPITVSSRSPSVSRMATQYQSFKCKWQNCSAELHNLETLKKHVHKVHQKPTLRGTLECLWGECGREMTDVDTVSGMRLEKHAPFVFSDEPKWREHLEIRHFSPMSWELGDGPASGLSDAHESDAYLSDAQGRRVTPRITAEPSQFNAPNSSAAAPTTPRGRGRPPKVLQEQEQGARQTQEQGARQTQERLSAQKKRVGGPGIDRGGATFANEKRRKGFSEDDQTEEEFVDAEE
ncbi:hypothetical protein K491DRAFT_680978 [Lophiostoma macrostomum CBS 122681]|uniref:C2H2-type domain-containing protein n=1 Tax=Lophiostoma macrostomum CBS 122681 TaxID=1314788 RepID=A0A6A6T1X5_9PLEO|nr:hypothetical protein K491DRAFT_680978 [Lophiostoma macrostomum CBS 122681]